MFINYNFTLHIFTRFLQKTTIWKNKNGQLSFWCKILCWFQKYQKYFSQICICLGSAPLKVLGLTYKVKKKFFQIGHVTPSRTRLEEQNRNLKTIFENLAYLTVILQVGEVQDLGPDLHRETFMLSHPRATSPIDFSIHALEILTWEGYDCPHSNSLCVQRRTEKQ